ncbi:hypothetical protein ACFVH0_13865 [Streptomyces sp. NPDC127117]
MTAALKGSAARGEVEYLILVGHTYACAACRRSPCPTAARLTRAWRNARR